MTISTRWQKRVVPGALSGVFIALTLSGMAGSATAAVVINNDPGIFFSLEKPTGKFDEPSFGGFNYWISSKTGSFKANDQYLNVGDETDETTAIATDWGMVGDLSGTAFDFSIQHWAGKNFSYRLTNTVASESRTLCWGIDCAPGSIATELLDGQPPVSDFNGLQIEIRAQEVTGSSTTVSGLTLSGLDIAPGSDSLFSGTVTPSTTSSFLPFDKPGRIGNWILGNDLALQDWELTGTVTLSRPDDATKDRNKVRLAVDLVKDTRIPAVPLPATLPLFLSAMGLLTLLGRRRRRV